MLDVLQGLKKWTTQRSEASISSFCAAALASIANCNTRHRPGRAKSSPSGSTPPALLATRPPRLQPGAAISPHSSSSWQPSEAAYTENSSRRSDNDPLPNSPFIRDLYRVGARMLPLGHFVMTCFLYRPAMNAPAPYFLGEDYAFRPRNVGDADSRIQIYPLFEICLVGQLAAIEGIFPG